MCCFDKTGTLTSDDMVLRGLAGLAERAGELLQDVKTAGRDTLRVLAACQSLIHIEGDLVGDPLERAAFEATGESAKPSGINLANRFYAAASGTTCIATQLIISTCLPSS